MVYTIAIMINSIQIKLEQIYALVSLISILKFATQTNDIHRSCFLVVAFARWEVQLRLARER